MKSTMTYEEMVDYIISLRESDTPPTDEQQEDVVEILAKVRADINNINLLTLQKFQTAVSQLLWRLNDWDANVTSPIDTSTRGNGSGVISEKKERGID